MEWLKDIHQFPVVLGLSIASLVMTIILLVLDMLIASQVMKYNMYFLTTFGIASILSAIIIFVFLFCSYFQFLGAEFSVEDEDDDEIFKQKTFIKNLTQIGIICSVIFPILYALPSLSVFIRLRIVHLRKKGVERFHVKSGFLTTRSKRFSALPNSRRHSGVQNTRRLSLMDGLQTATMASESLAGRRLSNRANRK